MMILRKKLLLERRFNMRGYNIDDYIGKKFNHLTLIKNLNKIDKRNSKLALFKCDCGNIKELVFTQVLNNNIKTCGCKRGFLNQKAKEKQQNSLLTTYTNKAIKSNKSTKIRGISKVNNSYRVRIQINKKSKHIGYFDNIEDAIKAREEAEEKYFKPILDKYIDKA